jgi:hypothetical protein
MYIITIRLNLINKNTTFASRKPITVLWKWNTTRNDLY